MRKLLALIAALFSTATLAQQPGYSTYQGTGQFPLSDPFFLAVIAPTLTVFTQPTGGYTLANGTGSCTLSAGTKKIIVVFGQSLSMNYSNPAYSVTNPTKNFTLNPFDGLCYQTQGTLVGTQTTTTFVSYLAKTADLLITNDSISGGVIIVPMMYGGTTVAQWTKAGATSFPYLYNNIAVAAHRLAALSITPTEIIWEQGTTDAINGTSQGSYTASLAIVIAQFKALWPGVPILINTESWNGSAVVTAIQNAQAAAIDNVSTFAGANTDTITGGGRYDTLHFNSTGFSSAASLLETAIVAH